MQAIVVKLTMIPCPGFGCVLTVQSSGNYQVIVSSLLEFGKRGTFLAKRNKKRGFLIVECNCPAFKDMIIKLNRKRNCFFHSKHLYFSFVIFSKLDPELNLFIHAPTFSFNEVRLILEGGALMHRTM